MKPYIKSLGFGLFAGVAVMFSSCNDSLDLGPVTQITPEDYYKSADQLQAYVNNYINDHLNNPFSGAMFHTASYNSGIRNEGSVASKVGSGGIGDRYSLDLEWNPDALC